MLSVFLSGTLLKRPLFSTLVVIGTKEGLFTKYLPSSCGFGINSGNFCQDSDFRFRRMKERRILSMLRDGKGMKERKKKKL